MDTTASIDLGQVSRDLSLPPQKIEHTVELLDEGNTVPFITRYRKDQTGGLDEQQIREIQQTVSKLRALAERKATILKSIETQGRLTPALEERIRQAPSTKELEDLYLPYKPKKQTLATLARQRGLEPLAEEVYRGTSSPEELAARAMEFVRVDRQLPSIDAVMQGVRHLLAERFGERADLRDKLRRIYWATGKLVSVGNSKEKAADERETPAPAAQSSEDVKCDDAQSDAGTGTTTAQETPAETNVSQAEAVASGGSTPAHEADAAEKSDDGKEPAAAPVAQQSQAKKKQKKKKKSKEDAAFEDYYDFQETVRRIPPHRVLAINRGEREKLLRVKIEVDDDAIRQAAEKLLIPAEHPHAEFLRECVQDALSRLVMPALEREIRRELTERAESHAVRVFARNLRKLLLQPPVRGHRVLAVDPGFRSGCKICGIDEFGNLLGQGVISIVGKEDRRREGREQLVKMICDNDVSVVAIGNGTACRQTEQLVADVIANELKDRDVAYVIVNEAGASVYSTSATGREELQDQDAMIRSAISIGRRLLDPLSELVKINPANLGVGMYQHDVKAKHLQESLDAVVESCVNFVGVDVNTASPSLLRYVSGLNQLTARRMYEYRQEHGAFRNREQFKEVPGFGDATFVQAAGFLKITGGDNPLDATWIHPESYEDANRVLSALGANIDDLAPKTTSTPQAKEAPPAGAAPSAAASGEGNPSDTGVTSIRKPAANNRISELVSKVTVPQLAQELDIGELLLKDILIAISRPGRDPRDDLAPPIFRRGIMKLEDLEPGMELTGTVLNVVDFGAFVDIGLTDSGLVHISRLADRYVSDPHEVVSVGDIIRVWVLEVDKDRRRVSLTAVRPGSEKPKDERVKRPPADRPSRGKRDRRPPPARGKSTPPRDKRRSFKGGRPPKKGKPKPVTPITDEMAEGKEPMRSFSDLKQFFDRQQDPPEDPGDSNEPNAKK